MKNRDKSVAVRCSRARHAVVRAGLCLAHGAHACPQNRTRRFVTGTECRSRRDYSGIFNQQHNQYEFVPRGSRRQGWRGSGRGDAGAGGPPGPWGAGGGEVAGGQPGGRHGRREIYGCEWIQVRARDGLLMGKKRRGNVAGPNGREEKSGGMRLLAERGGK